MFINWNLYLHSQLAGTRVLHLALVRNRRFTQSSFVVVPWHLKNEDELLLAVDVSEVCSARLYCYLQLAVCAFFLKLVWLKSILSGILYVCYSILFNLEHLLI